MGNVCCCASDEDYKHGAWYGPNDEVAGGGGTFNKEDEAYDDKATSREIKILLHEKAKDPGRRKSITSTPIDLSLSSRFDCPTFEKPPAATQHLLDALSDNFIFDSMEEPTKQKFVDAMQHQRYKKGEFVMKQGDVGDYFYVVDRGEVAFFVDEKQVATGSKDSGCSFGELALLYNTPRAASVKALTDIEVYKIDQTTFRLLLMSTQQSDRTQIVEIVKGMDSFKDLDEATQLKLVDAFTIVNFHEGERIMNKGDVGNIFYIVKEGKVKLHDIGHGSSKFEDKILEEGQSFGERALVTGDTRAASATAVTDAALLAISREKLEEIIGPLEQAIEKSSYYKYLATIPLFNKIETEELKQLVGYLEPEKFSKGEKIVAKGKLFWIMSGSVLMTLEDQATAEGDAARGSTSGELVKLMEGDYFGNVWEGHGEAKGLSDENGSPPPQAQSDEFDENILTVESDLECLTLLASNILKVVMNVTRLLPESFGCDSTSKEICYRQLIQNQPRNLVKRRDSISQRQKLNLSKLNKHRILGMGTFGKVWLVTLKPTSDSASADVSKTPYALKMISKRQLLQSKQVAAVLREKNIMAAVEHPFLLNMVSSFQDENYLYLVMSLILGGELFELIYNPSKAKSSGNLKNEYDLWKSSSFWKAFNGSDEEETQLVKSMSGVGIRRAVFYSSCVIEAFSYLHSRRIAYRDLKPENVLIDEHGYCVVVDMGFAKVVFDKTYTMCGTPEYIAPEVIVSKGHNHAQDYWSFGCLLYELIVGQTPFFDASIDQMTLLRRIVRAQYNFSDKIEKIAEEERSKCSSVHRLATSICHWKDLVSRLLVPKSVERIGNLSNGTQDILSHDWFSHVDFQELREHKIPAPWVPSIVDPLDTSHFGNDFGREERPEVFRHKLSDGDQEAFRGF